MTGFLNTRLPLVEVGLAFVLAPTAFLAWVTATCRVALAVFVDLVAVLTLGRFVEAAGDLVFGVAARVGLAVRIFAAFLARAFPAGERLVAGLRRVDFPATTRFREDDAADVWRDEERDESFFTLLAMGLLMRKALDSKTIDHKDRRKKQGESLT